MSRQTLGDTIEKAISSLPPEHVTLAEIRDLVGKDGLMILTAFLTLVFMIPVSIPGVSTVFGAGILLIGISRLFHRDLWLPHMVAKRTISSDKLRGALQRSLKWFRKMEKFSKPHRLPKLTSPALDVINHLALVLGAILLMAPFGLIPFSNTIPAVALLFFAIGFLQRDGVCILLGHLANILTIVYFAVLIGGGGVVIKRLWDRYVG